MNERQLTDGEDPNVNHSAFDAYINNASRKARALQRLLTVWLWLSSLLFPARHDVEMLMQPPPPPCCGRGCSGFFNKT